MSVVRMPRRSVHGTRPSPYFSKRYLQQLCAPQAVSPFSVMHNSPHTGMSQTQQYRVLASTAVQHRQGKRLKLR